MNSFDKITKEVNCSETTLYILCGLPYSGKTYFVKQLQKVAKIELVSIDDIFYSKGFDWDTNVLPDAEQWESVFTEAYNKAKKLLMEGRSVVFDSTNHTFASREQLRMLAVEVSVPAKVIFVDTHPEVVWKRWGDNRNNPTRSVVDRELIQLTIDTFESPESKEDVFLMEDLSEVVN